MLCQLSYCRLCKISVALYQTIRRKTSVFSFLFSPSASGPVPCRSYPISHDVEFLQSRGLGDVTGSPRPDSLGAFIGFC
jgi:hypothetical protein